MATGAGYPAVSGYIQVFRWQDASVNASWKGPSAWVQLGNDINGTHVHLSKNGLVIAIGKRGSDNRGRMTMYQWNQAQFEWEQMGNHIEGLDMLAESGRRSGEVSRVKKNAGERDSESTRSTGSRRPTTVTFGGARPAPVVEAGSAIITWDQS